MINNQGDIIFFMDVALTISTSELRKMHNWYDSAVKQLNFSFVLLILLAYHFRL